MLDVRLDHCLLYFSSPEIKGQEPLQLASLLLDRKMREPEIIKPMSQTDTVRPRIRLFDQIELSVARILTALCVISISAAAHASDDLQDACRDHFSQARQAEVQLEALKNQPLRMVRIGEKLDVALYDRLALVRRQRIQGASDQVRTAQSALSGCLARQLTMQQELQQGRLPAVASPVVRRHAPVVQSGARPVELTRPSSGPLPIVPGTPSSCDPYSSPGGCRVQSGKTTR